MTNSALLPTKAYMLVLQREIERHKPEYGTWYENWGDYSDPANRERVGRNILESRYIFEYPTRGVLDEFLLKVGRWISSGAS